MKNLREFGNGRMSVESNDPLFAMFDAPMEQLGKLLLEVPMFPLLSTVHFIMTAIALRSEHGRWFVGLPSLFVPLLFPSIAEVLLISNTRIHLQHASEQNN